ncbi:MAG TPA: PrsW family intramembrane metalloprotease [Cryptosporangiaceae bacterium]|nr:PrsW family intramembrane metalloprotease [Cryptosporangiaceae bacterium]
MAYYPSASPAVPSPRPPSAIGVGDVPPMQPWHRRRGVRVAVGIVAAGVIAFAGLLIFGFVGYQLGPMAFLLAAGAAILPVPILVFCFWWLDRYEPEPWHHLAFAFGWGACVATAASLLLNTTGDAVFQGIGGPESAAAVFVAPPVEEFFKALPLFLLLGLTILGLRQINGVIDGIVYAGMSAVGFAFTENILYFGAAYVEAAADGQGIPALIAIFVLRGVLSPFAHPLFTCMTGIGVGIAALHRQAWVRILAPLGGLLLAIGLHATWNLLASSGDGTVILAGYALFMVPVFIMMVVAAIVLRRREARVVSRALPAYINAGWFNPQEVASLGTMAGRRAARRWARSLAGGMGAKAMSDYQAASMKLAMLRDGLIRGIAGSDYADEEKTLLQTIGARRLYVMQNSRHRPVGPGWAANQPAYQPGYGPGRV